jgi:hypothetical protein
VATVVENRPDSIQYINASTTSSKDIPTLVLQSGDWQVDDHVEAGIVVDTFGPQPPILTSADARKLAKWLNRAADNLDGVKNSDKKKHRHRYKQEDDDLNEY